MLVIEGKVPILSWCENPEPGAIEQAINVANLPFVHSRVCLMPDTHQGYGMPIGGVVALNGVISPNMVGVDIGCGMSVAKSDLYNLDRERLKKIMGRVREVIPVGMTRHKKPQATRDFFSDLNNGDWTPVATSEVENALCSLGTLGGGNHFIEFQKDEEGLIHVMLHSGSRNLGKKICDYYNKEAKELNQKWHSAVDPKWDLAFLSLDSEDGEQYLDEMNLALRFAYANRDLMMRRIREIMWEEAGATFEDPINIHHNYAAIENHDGKNVVIHRKGATSARKDELGIIPGSQGTASYIVRGLGNPKSFQSCSHGAGRKMGRSAAQKTLNLEEEKKRMDDQGIIHGIRHISDLDEAAGAYKDVDVVMEEQKDLVEIVTKLTPIGVIKG